MKVVSEISALWLQQLSLHPREPRRRGGGCAHNSAFPPAEAPTTTGNQAAEAAGPIHYSSCCSGALNGGPPSLAAATVPTNPMTLEAVEAPVAPAYTSPMSSAAMVPMTQVTWTWQRHLPFWCPDSSTSDRSKAPVTPKAHRAMTRYQQHLQQRQ